VKPGACTQKTIVLEGTRRSYESYQIAVSSAVTIGAIDVAAGDLSDGAGHAIPAANVTFFRETFLLESG
jgi:hypothetical protein